MANVTQVGRVTGGLELNVAAAGATQAAGTPISGALNVVTSSTTSTAISLTLPKSVAAGDKMHVINTTAVALTVFPPVGGAINGGTADASVALGANKGAVYVSLGGGNWGAV